MSETQRIKSKKETITNFGIPLPPSHYKSPQSPMADTSLS